MRERKIKIGGVMRKFADLRTLKLQELQQANETRDIDELRWRYKSDGDVEFFELGQENDDDIIFGGDKSALRRIEDIERNISVLANKVVTASNTNSFVDTDANFGSLFDDDTRLKGNVNFYNANVTFSGSTSGGTPVVMDTVISFGEANGRPSTGTIEELASGYGYKMTMTGLINDTTLFTASKGGKTTGKVYFYAMNTGNATNIPNIYDSTVGDLAISHFWGHTFLPNILFAVLFDLDAGTAEIQRVSDGTTYKTGTFTPSGNAYTPSFYSHKGNQFATVATQEIYFDDAIVTDSGFTWSAPAGYELWTSQNGSTTPTGSINFNGLRLQGVGSPVDNSDAATKYFVTSYVASELQAVGPHYTDADARNAISVSGDLSYNASTGVISYTGVTTYNNSDVETYLESNATADRIQLRTNNAYFGVGTASGSAGMAIKNNGGQPFFYGQKYLPANNGQTDLELEANTGGKINVNNYRIGNVGNPIDATDAVNKAYVDNNSASDLSGLTDVGGSDTAATGDTILYDGTTWNFVTLEDEINTRITAASANTSLTGLTDVGFTNDTVADGDFLLYDNSNSKFGYVNFNNEASSIADARIAVTNSSHVSFGSSISATAFEGFLYDTNGNVIMDNTTGQVSIGGKYANFDQFTGDFHGEIIHKTTGAKVIDMQYSTPIYTGNVIGVLEGKIYDPNGNVVLDNGSINGTPSFGGEVTGNINSNGTSTFSGNVNFTGATITGIDLLPSQTNNAGYFLKTDGTNVSWAAVPAGYTDADADARIANASITDLSDVDATSQANNLALVYNSTTQEYVHGNLPSDYGLITDTATQGQNIATNHVGSGSTVSDLTDLGITDGTSGQVLTTDGNGSFTFSTITQGSNYGDANVAAYLNTNLDTSIIPDTNSVYDLGSAEYKFRDLYLSSNSIHLGEALITSTEGGVVDLGKQMNLSGTTLDFDRKPEVLTINTHAPDAGQDIDWFWQWEASLLYSRESIFNIVQEDITLYRRGTYTFVNFATMQMGNMTQAHGGFIKKIDGAGQQNNLDGTSVTIENRLNPFTGQIQEATVTTWVIPADFTASSVTLTQPSGIAYNVRHAPGAYEFYAGTGQMHAPAVGENPSIGPLYRGSTYTFNVDAAGHPFYFTTDDGTNHGANAYIGEYTVGVTGSRTDVGQITFTVPNDAPDTLFYQCGLHLAMRGQITIRDLEVPENVDPVTGEVTTTLVFQHGQEGMKSNLLIKDPVPVPDTACIMFDGEKFTVDDMKSYYQRSASFRDFLINDIANSGFIKGDDSGTISATGNITTTTVTATSYIVGDKELTPTDNSIAIDGVELTLGTSMERITLNQPGELQLTSGTHRWYAETNITVDKIVVRVDITPEGGDVGVVLNKTGANTGLNLTIAEGETKKTITPTNLTLTEDDYFTVDVTSVGSTAKGSGLTVTIHYYKS